jgi:hypothetical protein
MKKFWNRNEFQGKSENSLQTSYRIIFACIIIITLVMTWGLVYELLKMIF